MQSSLPSSQEQSKLLTILIVDDHPVMVAGLTWLLEEQPGMQVVGHASNLAEALSLAAQEQPEIVLLDVHLKDESGLDLLPRLAEISKSSRTIVLTASTDTQVLSRAVALGAMGMVLKEHSAEILIKAIERVHAGEVWLDRSLIANVLTEMTRANAGVQIDPDAAKIARLTEREREVVTLIGEGLRNKQIAERLFVSEATVRNHLNSIFGKLDVCDRLSLVVFAYRKGLAEPPEPVV